MKLLIIRHAIAQEREDFAKTGQDDSLRPLTDEGIWKMERVVRGLRVATRTLDVLGTSPYRRATQTADIVAKGYPNARIETVEALTPDTPFNAFVHWLRAIDGADTVAAIGHEPHLSALTTWLLAGDDQAFLSLKKGGAVMVEFEGQPRQGNGLLLWALSPALLRRLGGS